ncbi:hypothetical protein ACWCQ1_10385 [Streptomyces sp. NPDC002144]
MVGIQLPAEGTLSGASRRSADWPVKQTRLVELPAGGPPARRFEEMGE